MIRHSTLTFNDLPYMTAPERGEFKRMKQVGLVSIFKTSICGSVDCEEEVPKGVKTYCSEKCWRNEEGQDVEEDETEESGW